MYLKGGLRKRESILELELVWIGTWYGSKGYCPGKKSMLKMPLIYNYITFQDKTSRPNLRVGARISAGEERPDEGGSTSRRGGLGLKWVMEPLRWWTSPVWEKVLLLLRKGLVWESKRN